jgi:uncharacterized damage-inducible protein DinB
MRQQVANWPPRRHIDSMCGKSIEPAKQMRDVLLESFAVNEAINQLLLEQLDPRAWRAQPARSKGSQGRSIAAIFAHMHNIRRKWLRLSAPYLKLPAELDRLRCTQRQARTALAESARRCSEMIAEALAGSDSRVKQFVRDGWARPWPGGAAMVVYMITHEAHHRGQICMLTHQLGFPVKAAYKMWNWERLWKGCGFGSPR